MCGKALFLDNAEVVIDRGGHFYFYCNSACHDKAMSSTITHKVEQQENHDKLIKERDWFMGAFKDEGAAKARAWDEKRILEAKLEAAEKALAEEREKNWDHLRQVNTNLNEELAKTKKKAALFDELAKRIKEIGKWIEEAKL